MKKNRHAFVNAQESEKRITIFLSLFLAMLYLIPGVGLLFIVGNVAACTIVAFLRLKHPLRFVGIILGCGILLALTHALEMGYTMEYYDRLAPVLRHFAFLVFFVVASLLSYVVVDTTRVLKLGF